MPCHRNTAFLTGTGGDDSNGVSRASSVSTKDRSNVGKRKTNKQRRDDSESFESRSQFLPWPGPQQLTWAPAGPQFFPANGASYNGQFQQPYPTGMQPSYGPNQAYPQMVPSNGYAPQYNGMTTVSCPACGSTQFGALTDDSIPHRRCRSPLPSNRGTNLLIHQFRRHTQDRCRMLSRKGQLRCRSRASRRASRKACHRICLRRAYLSRPGRSHPSRSTRTHIPRAGPVRAPPGSRTHMGSYRPMLTQTTQRASTPSRVATPVKPSTRRARRLYRATALAPCSRHQTCMAAQAPTMAARSSTLPT